MALAAVAGQAAATEVVVVAVVAVEMGADQEAPRLATKTNDENKKPREGNEP